MIVAQYDAKDCTVMVDNTYITGLGEDMINFSKEEAYFETSVGAQGDIVENTINNSIHNLEVSVQATSPQKKFLMSKLGAKEAFPVWVVNKALGERFGGTMAKIKESPEFARGTSAEDMSFTFRVFDGVVEAI